MSKPLMDADCADDAEKYIDRMGRKKTSEPLMDADCGDDAEKNIHRIYRIDRIREGNI